MRTLVCLHAAMLPFTLRYLLAGALALFFVSGALANTEIVNFAAADSADLLPALLALTADWYVILVSCMMIHVGNAAHVPHCVGQPSPRMVQRRCCAYSQHR